MAGAISGYGRDVVHANGVTQSTPPPETLLRQHTHCNRHRAPSQPEA